MKRSSVSEVEVVLIGGIFGRWKAEFELGNAPSDSHPALRADRVRYDELGATIGDGLQLRPERSI